MALPSHDFGPRADSGISNLNPRPAAACSRRQTAAATIRSSWCSLSRLRANALTPPPEERGG
jgi:hypothetical protein